MKTICFATHTNAGRCYECETHDARIEIWVPPGNVACPTSIYICLKCAQKVCDILEHAVRTAEAHK